jgi:ATP-dependent RNA helicase DeaD
MVHARDRYHALKRIIDARPGFYGIVFCRTRVETQDVASRLVADGYNADTLHGDLSQDQRDRVMKSFRHRTIHILVATDVAARGLDVDDLTHVINFDLPGDPDVYTHRSGRTGRAGKAGISIVLVHMREDYKIRAIERIMNKRFEYKDVPNGREVVEARLADLMKQIREMDDQGEQLGSFMQSMNEQLGDLSRDEILRRFTMREMARLFEYYKNAPDLNVPHHHHDRGDRPDRRGPRPEYGGGRPERGPRPDYAGARPERGGPRPERSGPPPAPIEGNAVRLRINLGHRNGLTTPGLISVINRATPGPMLKLGRIRIMEQDSVFEVGADAAQILLPNLNRADFQGREVRAVLEQDPTHGMGRGHARAGGPPRHAGGYQRRHNGPPRHRD